MILADDHAMFREAVAELLGTDPGIEVVGQAENGAEAVALVREKEPEVAILDIEMPVMGAQAAMRQMLELDRPPRIIVATVFAHPRLVRELLGLGASAYLVKSAPLRELISTVHAVARGAHDNIILSLPRNVLDRVDRDPEGDLSARELEVLILAARGMSNRRIASTLNLVEGTVKRHLHNIYSKLEVGSRGEAVNKALAKGWFSIREITLDND